MIYITGDTHGEQNRMLWIERNIPFLKISNFKEKFDRFFHESYDNSQGQWQS